MKFTKTQQKIIENYKGNMAVIATAGAGKTSVLTHRIKHMIEDGVPSHSILAITFSKKAQESMKAKLQEIVPQMVNKDNVRTFHSLALSIIHEDSPHTFYVWNDLKEKTKIIDRLLLDNGLLSKMERYPSHIGVFQYIAQMKAQMKSPDNADEIGIYGGYDGAQLKPIYKQFEEYKRRNNYIEFDDFLNVAIHILDNNESILQKYKSMSKYILVDEYQDVSLSQAVFLRKLNTDNTMIVGDPLQAIYSFRGGSSQFMFDFCKNYPDVTIVNMNINYRCSKDILVTSNEFARTIADTKNEIYKTPKTSNQSFGKPIVKRCKNINEEIYFIIEQINNYESIGYNLSDIAILSRTNAQLQVVQSHFANQKLSFCVLGGNILPEQPEIKKILSYLQLANNVTDDESFMALYGNARRGINYEFFHALKEKARQMNLALYNAMPLIAVKNWRYRPIIKEITEVVTHLQQTDWLHVGKMIAYLRERLELDAYWSNGAMGEDGNYSEKIVNMNTFEQMCKNYSSIPDLLNNINYMYEMSGTDESVNLLTVHRAKGLEFKIVFIIGCNECIFPNSYASDIEEEKRIMYVAITRASEYLYFTYTNNYHGKANKISSFLEDIEQTTLKYRKSNRTKNTR